MIQSLSFGDVFRADNHFDAHLRADAKQMGKFTGSRGRVGYTPELTPGDRPYVLAHGQPTGAVLVSDDCSIDDAMGVDRNRRPQGRLLFASFHTLDRPAFDDLVAMPAFDRLPVEGLSGIGFGVIDLTKQFMVDVRDVDLATRTAKLSEADARELLVRLAAFGCRRGPLAALKSAERFAEFLAGGKGSTPSEAVKQACIQIARVVGDCWTLEGEPLDRAGESIETGGNPSELIGNLVAALRSVAASSNAAVNQLEMLDLQS